MLAGLDVVVNTNIITKNQDFSTVQCVGQDMEFEDIKNFLFKEWIGGIQKWAILSYFS